MQELCAHMSAYKKPQKNKKRQISITSSLERRVSGHRYLEKVSAGEVKLSHNETLLLLVAKES